MKKQEFQELKNKSNYSLRVSSKYNKDCTKKSIWYLVQYDNSNSVDVITKYQFKSLRNSNKPIVVDDNLLSVAYQNEFKKLQFNEQVDINVFCQKSGFKDCRKDLTNDQMTLVLEKFMRFDFNKNVLMN